MEEQVLQTIKKYNLIENGDKIVIGVSGGPDSICLLNVLNNLKDKLNFKIYVAHINHMIRKEADEETQYVVDFCKNLGIECYVNKTDVLSISNETKHGTEETGRKIRYDFFEEVLKKTNSNKIATAHNNNDKVETIIMNVLRGSGNNGLKGIEPIRDKKFIRPLIEIERDSIEKYCLENNLNPRIDKSNNENIYTRNKVRNIVIPYIQNEFNPNIIKTINRLSEVSTSENEYLQKIVGEKFNEIIIENTELTTTNLKQIVLDLKKFNNIDLVIKRRLILYTINKVLGSIEGIEKINIDDIIKLCERNIGNKFLMPTKSIKIFVKKGKIFFTAQF